MIFSCLITGTGGQGTWLASRIIGAAAIARGFDARGAKAAGFSRRSGCAVSHVRFGQSIQSPLIPHGKADLIIALEPAEAVRTRTYLSPTGRMLVLDKPVMPQSVVSGEEKYPIAEIMSFLNTYLNRPTEEHIAQKDITEWLVIIEAEKLIKKSGSSTMFNTALLGAAIGEKMLPLAADDIIAAMRELLPREYLDINISSFNAGMELAKPR